MSRAVRPTLSVLALAVALALGACSSGSSSSSPPPPPPPATCADGLRNGPETGVDCGGATCLALVPAKTCANGVGCGTPQDCASGFCNTTTHLCAAPTCSDGFKNGSETSVDCGGTCGTKCANGQGCANGADCADGFCNPTTRLCAAPACGDGFKNGSETDVDCGGSCGTKCATGLSCLVGADCTSSSCDPNTHVCMAVACTANGNTCPTGGGACCSGFCDGSNQCADPCKSNGTPCGGASECCTGVCSGSPAACQPPATCTANGQACPTGGGACCSGFCDFDPVAVTSTCADPCAANGTGCGFNGDCCSAYCDAGTKLCGTAPSCKANGTSCTADASCCEGYCNPQTQQCATPVSTCKASGTTCTTGDECCSTACDNPTQAANAGSCTTTAFCRTPGAACADSGECCSLSCVSGLCANTTCKATGAACASAGECCTGSCAGTCQALPAPSGTSACKTLGDACAAGAECCSTNCQGGQCTPAYLCHAPSDLCYRPEDCCSGMCTAPAPQTSPATPGRCLAPSGGCNQDGAPCAGASNCCTRLCKDMGAGVTVCAPASGCRMTGDFCDRTESCCGGSPDAINPDGYGIFCDSKGTSPGATQYDTSTKDERNCSGGQACNPPGNICGGSGAVPASQNCCNGKKAVCRQDVNDIWRCFGGCPGGNCTQECCKVPLVAGKCPDNMGGYDANNPLCCIPANSGATPGGVCQFRDQCCNFAPCVPDDQGVLRCTVPTCTPLDGTCNGADDSSCCPGTVCTFDGASAFTCKVPASCKPNGELCTVASECCSSNCLGDVCARPCARATQSCTTDGDCCAGLTCSIPGGATSGTCTSASTCAATGATCSVNGDCCNYDAAHPTTSENCIAGKCAVPPQCQGQLQSCTSTAQCCTQSPALTCIAGDGSLCSGGPGCVCDSCKAATQGCGQNSDCCVGLVCNAGTCQSCATVGGSCTTQSACCNGLTCADTSSGVACAGGTCTCEVCLPPGSACTTGGVACCGMNVGCLDASLQQCPVGQTCACRDLPL